MHEVSFVQLGQGPHNLSHHVEGDAGLAVPGQCLVHWGIHKYLDALSPVLHLHLGYGLRVCKAQNPWYAHHIGKLYFLYGFSGGVR